MIVAGVTTVCVPTALDVRVHIAPGAFGVFTAMAWVVPFTIVAQPASASAASANQILFTVSSPSQQPAPGAVQGGELQTLY